MKSKLDPRHLKRIKKMQRLFSWESRNHLVASKKIEKILPHIPQIDEIISQNAPKWPLEKINKIDISILRLAFWELLIDRHNPPRVVIDEAIEIAKEYGTESSSSFVNGVIGSALKKPPLSDIILDESHDPDTSKPEQP